MSRDIVNDDPPTPLPPEAEPSPGFDPDVEIPALGFGSRAEQAQVPQDQPIHLALPQATNDQRLNAFLPYKISETERIWRAGKDILDMPGNLMGSIFKGARDYSVDGDQTSTNIFTALFAPVVKAKNIADNILGINFDNPVATPEERQTFKKIHPNVPIPFHASQQLLKVMGYDATSALVNRLTLEGALPSPRFFTRVGEGALNLSWSLLTNWEQIPLAMDTGALVYGTRLGDFALGLSKVKVIGQAAQFFTAKAVQGTAFAAGPISLRELQGNTFQPIQDLTDVGRSALAFALIEAPFKLAGISLKGVQRKAFSYLKRRHQTMDPKAAEDINTAAVNQSARGTDPDMTIPLKKALDDQSAKFQAEMGDEGVTAESANFILDEAEKELDPPLKEKTEAQDKLEIPFKRAKMEPEFATFLNAQVALADKELKNLSREKVSQSRFDTLEQLEKLQRSIKKIKAQLDGERRRLKTQKVPKETSTKLTQLQEQLEGFQTERTNVKSAFQKLNDAEDLFEQRDKSLKKAKRVIKELKPTASKDATTDAEILQEGVDRWNNANQERLDAKTNRESVDLLRHFVNNKERFTKGQLDAFVKQQGPAREPFSADRDKPTPSVPGREFKDASNLVNERFSKEDIDDLLKDSLLTDENQADLDAIENAPKVRKSLGKALRRAVKCLLNRETS